MLPAEPHRLCLGEASPPVELPRHEVVAHDSNAVQHAQGQAGGDDPEWLQHLHSLVAALGDQHGMKLSVTSSS